MTQKASKFAKVLWEIKLPESALEESLRLYQTETALQDVLSNPTIYIEEKFKVIERVFPAESRRFLELLCRMGDITYLPEIWEAYMEIKRRESKVVKALLRYVTMPGAQQQEKLKRFLMKEFQAEAVELEMVEDTSLIGGFVLTANGQEWDWSMKHRINQMKEKISRR